MATAVTPPITVEQFLNFEAPEGYRAELIRGEIILSPDPKPLHHDIVENILELLREAIGKDFKVGSRCNMDIKELFSMPSPDVFVVTQEIWRKAREAGSYPCGAPILAVEVLSPANRPKNVESKTDLYLTAGSLTVWNVDLKSYSVTVHRKNSSPYVLNQSGKIHLLPPFPPIDIAISGIFQLR